MKRFVLLIAIASAGCDRIPGTTANLEKRSREILTSALFDAESAKFQNLKPVKVSEKGRSARMICGEVNAKNRMGAYVGFTRFVVGRDDETMLIDPREQSGEAEFNDAADQCSRAKSSDFGASWVETACRRVDELIERQSAQEGFNTVWNESCEDG